MHAATRQQRLLLVLLTRVWGFDRSVMKPGVTGFPPLAFRRLRMWIGLPLLFNSARWVGEVLHWQDWAAVVLRMMARSQVWVALRCGLWPPRFAAVRVAAPRGGADLACSGPALRSAAPTLRQAQLAEAICSRARQRSAQALPLLAGVRSR